MSLTDAKDLATIIGVVATVGTLVRALVEYRRNAVLRRIEYFSKIKEQFLEERFATLTHMLEKDEKRLAEVSATDKWRYLYFFEEVAVLLRAHLIRDEVACYMFGYYALLCDRSKHFWTDSFEKKEDYWLLFFDFVRRMRKVERLKHSDPETFVAGLRP